MDPCEEMELLLSTRLDGALSQEESELLEAHLAQCPSCRALAGELEAIHQAMGQLSVDPPAQLSRQIMAGLGPQERPSRRKNRWPWLQLGAVAFVEPVQSPRPRSRAWKTWGGMAAALVLILAGTRFLPMYTNTSAQLPQAQYGLAGGGEAPTGEEAAGRPELSQVTPNTTQDVSEADAASLPPENSRKELGFSLWEDTPHTSLFDLPQPEALPTIGAQNSLDSAAYESQSEPLTWEDALGLAAARIYGSSGQSGQLQSDGSLRILLPDGEEESDLGTLSYTGLSPNGRYYLFSWTWAGQTQEEADLFQYAVSLEEGEVLWKGDAGDGGASFLASLEE